MKNLFKNCKKQIDKRINEILDNEIAKYKNNNFIINTLNELKRLCQNGKRVRGYLVKVGQLLKGIDDDSYLDLAVAIEIFQTAVLIHDDIIDDAILRRGMETITFKYSGQKGLSKAICIGDLGFFLAYKIINNTNIKEKNKIEIINIFTKTIYNTVVGEIIDVELPYKNISFHKQINENIIYDIYLNKTAWYTIIGPLLIGATSVNISDEEKEKIKQIGSYLGIAFQIKDDLLGLYSDENNLGKTINDIKEGKQTIIYKYAIDNANEEQLKYISEYYSNPLIDEVNSHKIINLFDKIGAKRYAEELMKNYTKTSIKFIEESPFCNKDKLIDFANYLLERQK